LTNVDPNDRYVLLATLDSLASDPCGDQTQPVRSSDDVVAWLSSTSGIQVTQQLSRRFGSATGTEVDVRVVAGAACQGSGRDSSVRILVQSGVGHPDYYEIDLRVGIARVIAVNEPVGTNVLLGIVVSPTDAYEAGFQERVDGVLRSLRFVRKG
jgi:hypothetical protein